MSDLSPALEYQDQTSIRLEPSWKERLLPEFTKPYMHELRSFLQLEFKKGKSIYPKASQFFKAFEATPFEKVKVVILGQDPYHGPGQAHGLSFSVPAGVEPPPSLKNIYKELRSDVGFQIPSHGNLKAWADQGVLLLNATLSVEAARAGSHQNRGWEDFTDAAIEKLNQEREHLVFMLWGSYAQKKGQVVDSGKHLVLKAPHPSPLSAHRGFLGCHHFSKANEYLEQHHISPINWQI